MSSYRPQDLGVNSIISSPGLVRRTYLRWFGIPDVRTHLTGTYVLPAVLRLQSRAVLDVGCGSGLLTCLIAARLPGSRVSGWDRDAAAIDFATRLVARHGIANARFTVVDAEHDHYETVPQYDAIVSLAVLQFVSDVGHTLGRLASLLVPGGHFLLQVPAADSPRAFFMRAPALAKRMPDFHEARGGFSEAECRAMIDGAGLELLDLRPIIKGPTIVAKEIFYLALSVHRGLAALACPVLNWVTMYDRRYRGAGAGYFIVARKSVAGP